MKFSIGWNEKETKKYHFTNPFPLLGKLSEFHIWSETTRYSHRASCRRSRKRGERKTANQHLMNGQLRKTIYCVNLYLLSPAKKCRAGIVRSDQQGAMENQGLSALEVEACHCCTFSSICKTGHQSMCLTQHNMAVRYTL